MNVLGFVISELGHFSVAIGMLMGVAGAILVASLPKNPKTVPIRVRVDRSFSRQREEEQD